MQFPQLPASIEERIQLLEQIASSLGIEPEVTFSKYSSSTSQLSDEHLTLQRLLNRVMYLEDELQTHLASTKHEQHLIDKWAVDMKEQEEKGESQTMLERRREALLKKAKEYHKELNTVLENMPDAPPITVTQLTEQQASNKALEQQLKFKRAKTKTFQGLPPNLELARHELRNARNEQMKLTQLRERLLGRMAESVS